MKVFLQAYNGDKKAESRLKADLELEEFNLTIKQLQLIFFIFLNGGLLWQ